MKKFITICSGLRDTSRLTFSNVKGYLEYMQYLTDKNKYFPMDLVTFPVQKIPYAVLTADYDYEGDRCQHDEGTFFEDITERCSNCGDVLRYTE